VELLLGSWDKHFQATNPESEDNFEVISSPRIFALADVEWRRCGDLLGPDSSFEGEKQFEFREASQQKEPKNPPVVFAPIAKALIVM